MPRIHPADEEASFDLAITEQKARTLRPCDRVFLLLLALLLLGFGIARVHIGVIFLGKLTVRALDILFAGVFFNA